jgi:predicted transcriptional regulator
MELEEVARYQRALMEYAEAKRQRDLAITRALRDGVSRYDLAELWGLTPQRVSQVAKANAARVDRIRV